MNFTTRPEILGTFGVVTSTHWLASATGMAILEKGGNAFDAAVATGFALQVVEPHLNGPGGDVPMILCPAQGEVQVICGQGTAPQAATIAAFRELGLDLVPGSGLLPAVVPGAFDAWMLLLRDYGTLPPGRGADAGDCAGPWRLSAGADDQQHDRAGAIPVRAGMADLGSGLPAGRRRAAGRNPVQKPLLWQALMPGSWRRHRRPARDREAQIEAARAAWYKGFVAEAIDRFCRTQALMDTSGRRHHGLLRADDLAGWQATVEQPLRYDYQGFTLCKAGPWSQAPVALQQLSLLKGFDLSSLSVESPEFVHLVTECAKLAFADREAFYGDPDFVEVPISTLLSDDYATLEATFGGRSCVERATARRHRRLRRRNFAPHPDDRRGPCPCRRVRRG